MNKKTNYRWVICGMLFIATTINYMDRQVLSLTWKDFICPDFHWEDADYGIIAAVFSLVYAFSNVFSGRFIDRLGTKKGYMLAIGVWSLCACLHAGCGWATRIIDGADGVGVLRVLSFGSAFSIALSTSVWLFLLCRSILAFGESGNFPAAVKVTAESFPKKDRGFATSIFNSGSTVGALVAPLCIPTLARVFREMGAAHQSWSANLFSVGSDLFPKNTVATITGLNGMAGGISSFLINIGTGFFLTHIARSAGGFSFMGFE